MPPADPRRTEQHTLVLLPDGQVVLPDLASGLTGVAAALGGAAAEPLPGRIGPPRLARARALRLPLPAPLDQLDEPTLWAGHEQGARRYRAGESAAEGAVSWLDLKLALAQRLLGPGCRLCARQCEVDRASGERGFCGLGDGLRTVAPMRLWGEEEELGRPGLALVSVGCGLRCKFCYRPEHLQPAHGEAAGPAEVAAWIDAAEDAEHVHWLGGDPDESLPAILEIHANLRQDRPLVWNTHSYLTQAQAALLEGVVDAFVADLKFGPGSCAEAVAGVRGYWAAATRTLRLLAGMGAHLIVRHVVLPGHLDCCARPAVSWARHHLPRARVRVLDQYEPFGRALGDEVLGSHLSEAERVAVAALGQETGRTGPHGPGGRA